MITPRVDPEDSAFGSAYFWIKELAKYLDNLYVITIQKANLDLPKNVQVFEIQAKNKFLKVLNFYKFSFRIFKKGIDIIFPHMYLEFTFLIYPIAKLYGQPIIIWYAHSHVDLKLKLINLMANRIVTSTKNACRIKSEKIRLIGQGINTDFFKPSQEKKRKTKILLTLGRISPVKNLGDLIKAMQFVKNAKLIIVGDPTNRESDKIYLNKLKKLVKNLKLDNVEFHGGVNFSETLNYYQNADLFVHGCNSGLDRASLEAMSVGLPIITCSKSHKEFLKTFPLAIFEEHNIEELATKIKKILEMQDKERINFGNEMREIILKRHNVERLVQNLLEKFKEVI